MSLSVLESSKFSHIESYQEGDNAIFGGCNEQDIQDRHRRISSVVTNTLSSLKENLNNKTLNRYENFARGLDVIDREYSIVRQGEHAFSEPVKQIKEVLSQYKHQQKEQFFSDLKQKLSELDGSNSTKVSELISWVRDSRARLNLQNDPQLDSVMHVLGVLQRTDLFKPSFEELSLIDHWRSPLEQYGITKQSHEEATSSIQREYKQKIAKQLLEHFDHPEQLQKQIDDLESTATASRLTKAAKNPKKTLPPSVATNISETVIHLQQFRTATEQQISDRWHSFISEQDTLTAGRFSPIISSLQYCNLEQRKKNLSEQAVQQYLTSVIDADFFKRECSATPTTYQNTLSFMRTSDASIITHLTTQFFDSVNKDLQWIRQHISEIKQPYEQAADIHRGAAGGTCLANSAHRYKTLLEQPAIDSATIAMGATPESTFKQVQMNHLITGINRLTQSLDQKNLEKVITRSVARQLTGEGYAPKELALQKKETIQPEAKKTLNKTLRTKIERMIAQNIPQFVLIEHLENSSNHAINVQLSPKFRFMDDNLGIVECPDKETFLNALESWLTICSSPNNPIKTFELLQFSRK